MLRNFDKELTYIVEHTDSRIIETLKEDESFRGEIKVIFDQNQQEISKLQKEMFTTHFYNQLKEQIKED